MKNIVIHIPAYSKDNSAFQKPIMDHYDYWTPLAKHFLAEANRIEIHCWNDEKETIKELSAGNFQILATTNLTIFRGAKTSALSNELLYNFVNKDGNFKWFTIHLYKDESIIFQSEHWGTELIVPDASESDRVFVRSFFGNDTWIYEY